MIEKSNFGAISIDFVEVLGSAWFSNNFDLLVDELAMNFAGIEQYFVDDALNLDGRNANLNALLLQVQVRYFDLQPVYLRDPLPEDDQTLRLESEQLLFDVLVNSWELLLI